MRNMISGLCLIVILAGCSSSDQAEQRSCSTETQTAVSTDLEAVSAPNGFLSEARSPKEDWKRAGARALSNATGRGFLDDGGDGGGGDTGSAPVEIPPGSAQALAVPYSTDVDLSRLPDWPGTYDDLVTAFTQARDEVTYKDAMHTDFKRRAHWLYPLDGCSARAAHAARVIGENGWPRPGKVFLFGDLRMPTKYSTNGKAHWWYHTAAAVRFNGEALVFDAAVDPMKPLKLSDWISKMSIPNQALQFAVCDTYAYTAADICLGAGPEQDARSRAHIEYFLPYEWANLKVLHMDPTKLLGREPPWIPKVFPDAKCAAR